MLEKQTAIPLFEIRKASFKGKSTPTYTVIKILPLRKRLSEQQG